MESKGFKFKWSFVDKSILTNAMRNYKDEDCFFEMYENTLNYKADIIHSRQTGELKPMCKGGYGRFPMYYVIENLESKIIELGGTSDQHRFLFCLGAYICTFSFATTRITVGKIREYTGMSIKDAKDMVSKFGGLYGIFWSQEKLESNGRNMYYANLDMEWLKTKSLEIKPKSSVIDFDSAPKNEDGDFVETDEFQKYIDLFA